MERTLQYVTVEHSVLAVLVNETQLAHYVYCQFEKVNFISLSNIQSIRMLFHLPLVMWYKPYKGRSIKGSILIKAYMNPRRNHLGIRRIR